MTMQRHASRALAALAPSLRWRVRRAIAVGRWIGLSASTRRRPSDVYGAAFWDARNDGDWEPLAALVLQICAGRSIADVGCGDGKLLAAVRSLDPAVQTLGIDSSSAALEGARRRGVLVEQWNLWCWRRADHARLSARLAGFDVVVSLETAEHLPPWSGSRFVRLLTQGQIVIFSAAHQGQGGTLHMNERSFEYWRALFAARGFQPSPLDAEFREAVRAMNLPWWYAANIHVFERAGS